MRKDSWRRTWRIQAFAVSQEFLASRRHHLNHNTPSTLCDQSTYHAVRIFIFALGPAAARCESRYCDSNAARMILDHEHAAPPATMAIGLLKPPRYQLLEDAHRQAWATQLYPLSAYLGFPQPEQHYAFGTTCPLFIARGLPCMNSWPQILTTLGTGSPYCVVSQESRRLSISVAWWSS
ncbi:hypothetical protein BKA66DRAFT_240992 [Pyrenochaeta sp. MPI-SDFR-AT-0127]|nr:hypothetical protein BKA66DRAFT_240992 [Pyrenochaeta sp. MPI-SDFR-AT-0127]